MTTRLSCGAGEGIGWVPNVTLTMVNPLPTLSLICARVEKTAGGPSHS